MADASRSTEPGAGEAPAQPPQSPRAVEMADPRLSDAANRRVTAEAQQVIGADSVDVPVERPHLSRGELPLNRGPVLNLTDNRLLIRSVVTAGVVIGAILALTTGDWWLLPLTAIVLGAATVTIVTMVLRMVGVREHLSPATVAALEAEGVRSPDELFSAVVEEFGPADAGDVVGEDRTSAVEDDHRRAAVEHGSAGTPTGGRSRSVGP